MDLYYHRSAQQGWSALELLTTLSIVALVALTASTSLRGFQQSSALKHAARRILLILDEASAQARLRGKDIALSFDTNNGVVSQQELLAGKNKTPRQLYKLPKNITLETARFGNLQRASSLLEIRSTGTASPGRIELTAKDNKCSIIVALRQANRISCNW